MKLSLRAQILGLVALVLLGMMAIFAVLSQRMATQERQAPALLIQEQALGAPGIDATAGVLLGVAALVVLGAMGLALRLTGRVGRLEAALQQKSAQLIQSEKLSSLGELTAGLVHEVKNPMVGIVGFTQLGLEATTLAQAKEYLGLVQSSAERANAVLQSFLEFSRPSESEQEELEPNEVVQGALRLVVHQLKIGEVFTQTQLAAGLPRIRGNANQLRQVLINLMLNAGQAMETTPERQLFVSTEVHPAGGVLIAIRDTGVGMSQEVQKVVFEPFFTTKPEGKGTGLGLSVSSSIVVQHGGEIRVESTPGKGTVFMVRLPAAAG